MPTDNPDNMNSTYAQKLAWGLHQMLSFKNPSINFNAKVISINFLNCEKNVHYLK
jgi:hypothetical protein